MQNIIPILRYSDARAAIRWLCDSFGFVEVFSVPPSGPVVRHAQLRLGTNIVMLGLVRPDDGLSTPRELGAATQAICVRVDDVDAHHARARTAGAQPAGPPQNTDFGERQYSVLDLDGHPWTFTASELSPPGS